MKISVVIPSRNREELLKRAIASVEMQGHFIEVIIIDNMSDKPIIHDLQDQRSKLRLIRNEEVMSAAQNRNIGINAAIGDIICFLDDDDEYLPGKFDSIVEALTADETLDFVYASTVIKGPNNRVIGVASGPCEINNYLLWRYIHCNALAVRKSVFSTHMFDENMGTYEDVKFVGDLIKHFHGAQIEGEHAIWYRDGRSDQLTKRNFSRSKLNWKILCVTFKTEIDANRYLRALYYRKMAILFLISFDLLASIKYGIEGFRKSTPCEPA